MLRADGPRVGLSANQRGFEPDGPMRSTRQLTRDGPFHVGPCRTVRCSTRAMEANQYKNVKPNDLMTNYIIAAAAADLTVANTLKSILSLK